MKTQYFNLFFITFPAIIIAQISSVNLVDTSLQSSGISNFESADLDNDGFNELITSTTGNSGNIGFYQNLTNNNFSSFNLIEPFSFCEGFAIGDFNNDNWKDIVSIGGINKESNIYINNSGTFSSGVLLDSNISIQVNDVVVADFDNNNFDDIVIIGQHSIDLYRNNGSGSFTKETILSTSTSPRVLECLDLAATDMDNDGDIDLVTGETEGLVIYTNNGNANFSPNYYSVVSEILLLIHIFDINNDGKTDVIAKNNAGDVKWFSNNGNSVMTFEVILPNIPNIKSLTSIDYDNDGLKDIYASYTNNISIFKNDFNQSFNNEISVYQDSNLLMGPVQTANVDNLDGLDYVWSGGTNTIAFHINQSLLSTTNFKSTRSKVYPNPTKGLVNFTNTINTIRLYNLNGFKLLETYNKKTIDLSKFPTGFYTIIIENDQESSIHKIIKY